MTMTPEEHERLARVDERTAAMKTTLDDIVTEMRDWREMQARHDEQIKTLQRGGGGALAVMLTLAGAWLKQKAGL